MSEEWSFESLWQKARLYVDRALAQSRESALFPLWSIMALELLGRATLGRVHPALLADPQSGDNILYAYGYGTTKKPKSIPAKTVFLRCKEVVTGFTENEFAFVMALMDRRNEELHSGSLALDSFSTEHWLAEYYRVCGVLLGSSELSLSDFLGEEEGKVAEAMVKAASADLRKDVRKRVSAHRTVFEGLNDAQKKERLNNARIERFRILSAKRAVPCPACGSEAVVTGEVISRTEPHVDKDELVWEERVLPTALICFVCGLELRGHEALHSVNLGGQFAVEESVDAYEYYKTEFDPSDYYDGGYLNE